MQQMLLKSTLRRKKSFRFTVQERSGFGPLTAASAAYLTDKEYTEIYRQKGREDKAKRQEKIREKERCETERKKTRDA